MRAKIVQAKPMPITPRLTITVLLMVMALFAAASFKAHANDLKTDNVFLITLDGMRWQEVFSGVEAALISKQAGGVGDTNRLGQAFWRDSLEERRKALLPFFWNVIAREGQLVGNRDLNSKAQVTNGKNFTYPGFNEILTGFPDEAIDSNASVLNKNVTVFEWLNQKRPFKDHTVAFANWDVFSYILNAERAGIPIWTGYKEGTLHGKSDAFQKVAAMAHDITPVWDGMNFDVFFYHATLEYMREQKPRLVWLAFSETDEWAHEGRYDLYLKAAHRIDSYIKGLWDAAQSMRQYKGKTTFILTTDHGRGTGPSAWRDHGASVKGAEEIWIAILGPDTPSLGERRDAPTYGQNQIAATIAALLGHDYKTSVPRAGDPITEFLRKE